MTYAIPSDIATALGRAATSQDETDQWQAWLDIVERAIERTFRRAGLVLADQVIAGDPTTDDVKDVEVAAVIRKIQNPTWGITSATRSLDDGSVTTRNESGSAYVDPLALLPDEISGLLPSGGDGAFSVRPYFEPDCSPVSDWLAP